MNTNWLRCGLGLAIATVAAGGTGDLLADDKPAAGKQEAQHLETEITIKVNVGYLLYLPKEFDAEKKTWPLVLFLHGSGESGSDLNKVKIHGPPKLIAEGKDFPFIVVSPQATRGWNAQSLNALLDDVVAKYPVDKDRIYVTGLSMGGYGTWSLAAAYPNRFAAIVPICGGGNPAYAVKLKDLPIWVFHGAKDSSVPLSASEQMVDALKDAGAKAVKFTVYPDAEHDSWTETYNNPELYEWLLKQSRADRKS